LPIGIAWNRLKRIVRSIHNHFLPIASRGHARRTTPIETAELSILHKCGFHRGPIGESEPELKRGLGGAPAEMICSTTLTFTGSCRAFREEIDGVRFQLWVGRKPSARGITIMKFVTIALALVVAFSGTVTAQANDKSVRKLHRDRIAKVRLHPNYGNPNGDADGPTTLSGTGSSKFGGSSPGTSGRN
jgi:hypothetical protein